MGNDALDELELKALEMTLTSDSKEIAVLLPQLVSGLHSQREMLAGLQASQEKTNTIQEHMLRELQVLKEDRVMGDREIDKRLSELEKDFSVSRQAPWSLLMSATGIAISAAGIIGGLVWFAIQSQTTALETRIVEDKKSVSLRLDDMNEKLNKHVGELGHPHSVVEKITALESSTKEKFEAFENRLDERLESRQRELQGLKSDMQKEIIRLQDRAEYLEKYAAKRDNPS